MLTNRQHTNSFLYKCWFLIIGSQKNCVAPALINVPLRGTTLMVALLINPWKLINLKERQKWQTNTSAMSSIMSTCGVLDDICRNTRTNHIKNIMYDTQIRKKIITWIKNLDGWQHDKSDLPACHGDTCTNITPIYHRIPQIY